MFSVKVAISCRCCSIKAEVTSEMHCVISCCIAGEMSGMSCAAVLGGAWACLDVGGVGVSSTPSRSREGARLARAGRFPEEPACSSAALLLGRPRLRMGLTLTII